MKRRDLLKLLPVASIARLSWFGKESGAAFEINSNQKKVLLFINENVIPAKAFANTFKNFPVEVVICPVSIPEGQKIDDVIRMYEIPH